MIFAKAFVCVCSVPAFQEDGLKSIEHQRHPDLFWICCCLHAGVLTSLGCAAVPTLECTCHDFSPRPMPRSTRISSPCLGYMCIAMSLSVSSHRTQTVRRLICVSTHSPRSSTTFASTTRALRGQHQQRQMATVHDSLPHEERTATEPRESQLEPVILSQIREVNENIRLLRLQAVDHNRTIKVRLPPPSITARTH